MAAVHTPTHEVGLAFACCANTLIPPTCSYQAIAAKAMQVTREEVGPFLDKIVIAGGAPFTKFESAIAAFDKYVEVALIFPQQHHSGISTLLAQAGVYEALLGDRTRSQAQPVQANKPPRPCAS
jgi:hypothetical protein